MNFSILKSNSERVSSSREFNQERFSDSAETDDSSLLSSFGLSMEDVELLVNQIDLPLAGHRVNGNIDEDSIGALFISGLVEVLSSDDKSARKVKKMTAQLVSLMRKGSSFKKRIYSLGIEDFMTVNHIAFAVSPSQTDAVIRKLGKASYTCKNPIIQKIISL